MRLRQTFGSSINLANLIFQLDKICSNNLYFCKYRCSHTLTILFLCNRVKTMSKNALLIFLSWPTIISDFWSRNFFSRSIKLLSCWANLILFLFLIQANWYSHTGSFIKISGWSGVRLLFGFRFLHFWWLYQFLCRKISF